MEPRLSEFESEIYHYEQLELSIDGAPEFINVGTIALFTGDLKFVLV